MHRSKEGLDLSQARKMGRQKRTWLEVERIDLKKCNLSEDLAQDRSKWMMMTTNVVPENCWQWNYIKIVTCNSFFVTCCYPSQSMQNNELFFLIYIFLKEKPSFFLFFQKVVEILKNQSAPGGLHENTFLIVMGDHGQTVNGDHGGGTAEEV